MSEEEYKSLLELLKQQLRRSDNPLHAMHLGACFCLFVSEQYRRNYNSSWSWSGAEAELGISLTPQQHAALTNDGLAYWKRPIRFRNSGRDWLGSLFTEGGLPWPLVQSESHGFGRAVRRGIKHFYRTEGNRRTTADLMADFEEAFRPLSAIWRRAGCWQASSTSSCIWSSTTPQDLQDPASHLDQQAPGWTDAFPIPLDESNARTLLNDWLRDAGQKRQERKEARKPGRSPATTFCMARRPNGRYAPT